MTNFQNFTHIWLPTMEVYLISNYTATFNKIYFVAYFFCLVLM